MIGGTLAIAYIVVAVFIASFLVRVDIGEFVGPITPLPGPVQALARVLSGFVTNKYQRASSGCGGGRRERGSKKNTPVRRPGCYRYPTHP